MLGFIVQLILFSEFAETYSMVALVNQISATIMLIALCRIKSLSKMDEDLDWNGDIPYILHLIFFVSLGFIDGIVIIVTIC